MSDPPVAEEQRAGEKGIPPSPGTADDLARGEDRTVVVGRLVAALPRFAMLLLLFALIVVFSALRPETFATADNARTILLEASVLAILALGLMLPLIAGDFDLSIASVLGLASLLAAGLTPEQGVAMPLVIPVVLAMGACIGLLHGMLIVKAGLPSIVVTLGTNAILGGFILLYSGGAVIYEGVPESLTSLGRESFLGLRLPIWYLLVIAVLLWFLLEKRPWGRYLYATGASHEAARLTGINTDRTRMVALVMCSTLAALAGIILTGRIGAGNPTIHTSFFLPAFAATFLSLAAFKLGFFNPWGVVASVYLLAVGVNGLQLLGVPFWVEPMFNGAALIVAIALAQLAFGSLSLKLRAQ